MVLDGSEGRNALVFLAGGSASGAGRCGLDGPEGR
jgi:hypothetical protein